MPRVLLIVGLLVAAALSVLAAPRELLTTDFGAAGNPVLATKGVTGSVPPGWGDNSGWNPEITLQYQPLKEDGVAFLRVSKRQAVGRGQLASELGTFAEAGEYCLDFTARSRQCVQPELGLRQVNSPYQFVWSVRPTLRPDWQTYHYTFHLDAQQAAVGLWIYFVGEGEYDLRDLSLRRYTREDLIAEMKDAHPGADTGNLVRNSRFPLGLQSGWSIDREVSDGDVVTLTPDRTVTGPCGATALRIETPVMTRIYTAPVTIPWSFMRHTASLYLRGEGTGQLVIVGDGRELAWQPFTVHGADWQRVQLTFTPVFNGKIHALRIDGRGRFWVDALQVEAGESARPYAAPQPREVALALPDSAAAAARVQFDDEPAVVNYCVTGTGNGVLRASVVNVYGQRKALPPVPIGAGFRQDGTLRYSIFPAQPYGPFRIEAWVEDARGQRISPPNELVVNRLHRPRYWGQDAPDSPFGVHTIANTRHLLMAKAIGANWVRLHDAGTQYIGWCYLEPVQGQWHFADQDIQRYRAQHLKILGMLSTAPGWATNWQKPTDGYIERYMLPLQMDDFASYVRTVTTHYRGVIDSYEVWNEPWGDFYLNVDFDEHKGTSFNEHFVRSKTPEADYLRLMHTAYTTAKAVDPSLRIIGISSSTGNMGKSWTRGLLRNAADGGLSDCDAISYHHYSSEFNGSPSDSTVSGYAEATGELAKATGPLTKPVWMTEGDAYMNGLNFGMYHYTTLEQPEDDNIATANRLARYMVSHRALGEAHTFLYSMHAQDYFAPTPPEWSALITSEGYLHPSANAHAALTWLLEDTKFVKLATLADGVYAYYFQGKGRTVAVLSSAPFHADFTVPHVTGIAVTDLYGNPINTPAPLQEQLVYLTTNNGIAMLERALAKR